MKKSLLTFCVLFSVWADAQTWTNYLVNTSYYTSIAFDAEGNKWFCGHGVNFLKYDNESLTSYTIPGIIHSYTINYITIDSEGNKWFATSIGVWKFDGSNWSNYTTKNGLASDNVSCIKIDANGVKWFGTYDKGVSKFDGSKWINFSTDSGLINNQILTIEVDYEGNKWFGTNNGVSKYNDSIWTNFTTNEGLCDNYVHKIIADSLGNKWFGTYGGVSKFDDNKWTSYNNNTVSGFSARYVFSIAIDHEGNKWFGTEKGVLKFDGIGCTSYTTTDGLLDNNVYVIEIDSEGNKWIGTGKGISKFDGNSWYNNVYEEGLPCAGIVSAMIDSKGNKWFSDQCTGLSKFDDSTWTKYSFDLVMPNGVLSTLALAIDKQDNIWLGTRWKGVIKFDGINRVNYAESDGLVSNEVSCVYVDNENNKWFGTFYNGVSKFDGQKWTNFDTSNGLPNNTVYAISSDLQGNIWFATSNNGVSKFDGEKWITYTISDGLVNDNVLCISVDQEGNMWFGTIDGVSKFDGKKWISYTTSDGLLDDEVRSIAIDSEGNKWFGTRWSVTKFDGTIWKNYTTEDGLVADYTTSILIDSNGNKWITTQNCISKLSDNGSGPLVLNKIQKGMVFNDQNANGKRDSAETLLVGQIIKIDNNYITTQNNGLFYTSLNNGPHTFTFRPKANWQLTTDSSITVTVTDAPIKDTLFFGVQAIANKHEIETKLTGTATRAGFQSKSWINYTNLGTLAENGTISYTLADESSLVQTIPVSDSVIGKRLVWKYSNLIPNEQRQISITTQMPGVNYLGDTLVSISKIKSAFSEFSDTLKQVLTGSYDPNDKLVAHGIGNKGYVLFGKELEYTVRFQNTGTDTAFNVNIRDTLDLNLDVASLQIVASSHPVKLDLRGQNEATFRFENILLPDSNVNQLGSNGFVKYTIKPKKNLPENTSVKNKAHIYFDFNPAIITNETENTYVSKLPSVVTGIYGFQSNKSASIFPNPAKDEFTIVFPQSGTYEISLSNIQGKSIKTWNEIVGQETTLSVDGVEPGMYLYTARGRNGQKYMGKVVVR